MMDTSHKPFTGWHMLALTVGAFGLIIAVNVFMAFKAISTFPGLEVQSSYDDSQNFDKAKAAQEALGWTLKPSFDQGQLRLAFTDRSGQPVVLRDLDVLVGRPTETSEDWRPQLQIAADGAYVASADLRSGKWMLQITGHAQDGTPYQARSFFFVGD